MNPARRRRTSALAALALLACCMAAPASAAQWALLVGVGDYPDTAFDLEGPAHDVAALRRELVENLGYPEAQVNALVDADATRANILDALRRLERDAAPGDFVLVYLSGHGTSAYDPNRPVALAHDTGAFVPVDYQAHGSERRKLDTLLVGSRDLRPVLAAIDEKDVHGLVLIDSCYARNTSRSLHAATPPAYRSLDSGLRARSIGVVSKANDYPYSRLLTMAASGAKEVAIDLNDPARTLDGKPHGAFTDAVLRALRELPGADANGDAVVTNQEFFADVKLRMAVANIPHSPQMLPSPGADHLDLAGQAAFRTGPTTPTRPAPLPTTLLSVKVEGALPLARDAVEQTAALVPAQLTPDLIVRHSGGAYHILTPFGDAVASLPTERQAASALRQQPWIRELVWKLGRNPNAARVRLSLRGETFEEGELLEIGVTPDDRGYLLVLDIAPSGALRVLYPSREGELRPASAQRPVLFRAQVTSPFGMDYIVADAFPQPPSFYDARLFADVEIAPATGLHRELARAFSVAAPRRATALKIVTVPRSNLSSATRSESRLGPTRRHQPAPKEKNDLEKRDSEVF